MSLKHQAGRRLAHLIKRLDTLNCALAERALPESRRRKVSELSIRHKALKAGQKSTRESGKNS